MSGEVSISLNRGNIKIVGEIPVNTTVEQKEEFAMNIMLNLLGYSIKPVKPDPEGMHLPVAVSNVESSIPRTGLISINDVLKILGIGRTTLDNWIKKGFVPPGGKAGGTSYRKWDAQTIWEIAEKIAKSSTAPKQAPWLKRGRSAA